MCPACALPGAVDAVCPNCGRNMALPRHRLLMPELVAPIQARVETEWHVASRTYSQVTLPLQQFAEKVVRVVEKQVASLSRGEVSQEETVQQLLDTLKWSDLFLTTACAAGDSAAWEVFRRQYRSVIQTAALKASTSASEAAELSDTLLTDLFLPHESGRGESKIAQYHGLGSLEGWIKVVVHRMAIDQIRLHRRDVPIEDMEAELPSNSAHGRADESIKERDTHRAREMVSQCLTTALEQLNAQERLVLNLYYLNGVNLKGIGQFLKAHESTASRLIERLKTQLHKSVNKQLQDKFKVRKTEVPHLIELAQGHLEIDLKKILSQ
jgi:RNA polymerase sigma-70 factor, ECF subfamily